MEKLIVNGGKTLKGKIKISGSKNSCLPILAASLLAEEYVYLNDVPVLSDVEYMTEVLENLGANVEKRNNSLKIDARFIGGGGPPYDLVRKMRASFLTAGPLLARRGQVKISLPGGCAIGSRPIDLHLKGFKALGAKIEAGHGVILIKGDNLKGERIYLDFPSVGATENIIMAATKAQGTTVIENAAEEPEIVDLANFLNSLGARVSGGGTKIVKIEGVKELAGSGHTIIPDRIEAGTYMVAAAITRGSIIIENVILNHLKAVTAKLKEAGVKIEELEEGTVRVKGEKCIRAVDIKTLPCPGFPTDMQPQFMALLTLAKGTSVIKETVFENRFMHVPELKRMGADIKIEGPSAVIQGVKKLSGSPVRSTDLRAGAALVLAGLAAEDVTEVYELDHLDRGYPFFDEKLRRLGADIQRVRVEESKVTIGIR
ncbi:MAG: UDP-N-acetylglucosamine 1-carboxyvinyltransferase [Firmicutes bacterium HGW-Firmicutes-13]|nr:MAG: UDP-N-acetylglucosamine 1-carboxyvinyltransferase [Firmicutes bacterium HGW-Firmicutes-13]